MLPISDKGAAGLREDTSGPGVGELLRRIGAAVELYEIVPGEPQAIRDKLIEYADQRSMDLVVTTGGTGVSPRDITPDVTREVLDREIPGMGEIMRMQSFAKTPHAVISRATAGIRRRTLIINLPGSPRGATENLLSVLDAIPHAVSKIKGDPSECAAH